MDNKYSFNDVGKDLYSAVIVDILDDLGYRNQAMRSDIRPLTPDLVVVGRAFTVLATDVYEIPEYPYKLELESVDHLTEGDVVVATTNGSVSSGFWGELLSTASKAHGARGGVIDGMTRDSKKIQELGFTLFARGRCPLDSKGRTDVIAYQVPIECGGVQVKPGDIIFGDDDGVVVIPQEVADETLRRAYEKVRSENIVRDEILNGASAVEVWEKYHIL